MRWMFSRKAEWWLIRYTIVSLVLQFLFSADSLSLFADPGIVIIPNPPGQPVNPLESEGLVQVVSSVPSKDPRDPIPNGFEQARTRQVIEDKFKEEYSKRQSPEGRLQLAQKLLDEGRLTVDDPVGRYCMLQDARTLGIELGEPAIVVEAIEELADSHRVSLLNEKLVSLKQLGFSVRGSTAFGELARIALKGMRDSVDADDFSSAYQFQQIAEISARQSQFRELNDQVKARTREMIALQREYQGITASTQLLLRKPDDPGANLQVGMYYAFSRDDWKQGLPMLARTNDNDLRRLAQNELGNPIDVNRRLQIADGWWNLGAKFQEGSIERKHVLRHALEWYRLAHPQLRGLSEARVARIILDFQSLPERMTYEEQVEAGEVVFLSALNPIETKVDRQAFGSAGLRITGEKLMLKKMWYDQGLYAPPSERGSSSVVYELPGTTFNYFRAVVGIDDAASRKLREPLTFEVWGDNQRLWESDPISGPGEIQACRVQILTVRRLELKVVCPDSNDYAWAVWGNPRLMMR